MIDKKINIPIYDRVFRLMFTDDLSEVENKYNVHNEGVTPAAFMFYHTESGLLGIAFDTNLITNGIIAHEAKHLVNIVFAWHGIHLDVTNDEPEAYLLGWVVDQIHKHKPNERTKKPRPK